MEKTEYFEKAAQHIIDANEEEAVQLAQKYLDEGLEPVEMIEKGLSEGIRKLGDLFDRGEVFLPHLIIASEAMTAAIDDLRARLHGQLIEPGDDAYREACKVYNGMIDKRPGLIARCANAGDVVAARFVLGEEIAAIATTRFGSRTRIERAAALPSKATRIFSPMFMFRIWF